MAHQVVSLRAPLRGAVDDFLSDESMTCPHTQDGLVAVINALATYREEGKSLFPEVFVFDSIQEVLSVLPGSYHVRIGEGGRTTETLAKALKKCAPLAINGWAIYILREVGQFVFGLIRCGTNAVSLTISDLLIDMGDPVLPAVFLRQVAENIVEVRGVAKNSVLVHFGAARDINVSPADTIAKLAASICQDADPSVRDQSITYFSRLLHSSLKGSHGALVAVMSHRKRAIPKELRDGIPLSPPLDVCGSVLALVANADSCSRNTQLQSLGNLISGMLNSDGVTLFNTRGAVLAYSVFIKHPSSSQKTATAFGGARRRTFDVLSRMVGSGLACAFMQSQDGKIEFKTA